MSLDETRSDLLKDLGLPEDRGYPCLDAVVDGRSRYVRDLRVNLRNVFESEHLSGKETSLLALAIAVNERNDLLIEAFRARSSAEGASPEEIAETYSCASLLASNNVFYRFKHFVGGANDAYQRMPARIKMNIMARPQLGKEMFELMSLVISAVNGCEACVGAHENSVRRLGCSEARIFDAIRLGSVIRGASLLIR